MKVINLDKIVTRKDKVVILDGVEHALRSPTVKDYIDQMRTAKEIDDLTDTPTVETAQKVFELTIETLRRSFPTITNEQFHSLTMDQLNALRALAEDSSEAEAPQSEQGEAQGKAS